MKLTGKIAVVTGASSGIGAGIAKAMGAAGATVIINYSSSKTGADAWSPRSKLQAAKQLPSRPMSVSRPT